MSSEKGLLSFHMHLSHLHNHHHHHHSSKRSRVRDIPKGCLAIMIGQGDKQQRFIVPVFYLNHPLFMQLLKQAEEEYGFDQKGTITIPCRVEVFRYVQGMIDKEQAIHHNNHHRVCCFRA